jgi:pimeloyl-ACP methyl ester carboxylesterase
MRHALACTLLALSACSEAPALETRDAGPSVGPSDSGPLDVGPQAPLDATTGDAGAADALAADAVPTDSGEPPIVPVEWTPCSLYTEGGGPAAECAVVRAPVDRRDPGGRTLELFVKRFRPEAGNGARALWMLQGGPGASGYVFERLAEQLATRFPDVDYYMPDHRGTGRSTRLGCAREEADTSTAGLTITAEEWPSCRAAVQAEHGADLAHFSTTGAAHDLGVLIASARRPDQPTFVYGVSYGTSWAHRYLQLFPHQADGVILDSIAAPGLSLLRQDEDTNTAARDFFATCSRDAFCSSKLGPDAWARAEALVAKLKTGHCPDIAIPEAPTHVLLRRAFGSFLMDATLRPFIPAIVYRADRCEPRDVAALRVLLPQLVRQPPPTTDQRLWSWVVTNNVLFSEFDETPQLTPAQLEAIREAAVASRDVTTVFEQNLDWPKYPADEYVGRFADTDSPLLFLSGGLDPATIIGKARVMRAHFTRPHQTWVEIPWATHTTIVSSPFLDESGERRSCGTRLLMRFLESPTTPLDTSCADAVIPIDFTLPRRDLSRALFLTSDGWE